MEVKSVFIFMKGELHRRFGDKVKSVKKRYKSIFHLRFRSGEAENFPLSGNQSNEWN